MRIAQLRDSYHRSICDQLLVADGRVSNIAGLSSPLSNAISSKVIELLSPHLAAKQVTGHAPDFLFTELTKVFLQDSFTLMRDSCPGEWQFSTEGTLQFEQYEYMVKLQRLFREEPELKTTLEKGYLLLTPDILVGRYPVANNEINPVTTEAGDVESVCRLSLLQTASLPSPCWIFHAVISCKWTIRTDRAQNTRTEVLNLIRNRKGHLPHIVAVTAEPWPARIAALALGTGDLDCVYHFALPELIAAATELGKEDSLEMLKVMIDGKRLRDISDLPFDLAV